MVISQIKATALASMAMIAPLSHADSIKVRADHPGDYVVKKGDTLWDISSKFLDNPWQWPEIWHQNRQIDNPHLIFPGNILSLTYVDGQPRIIKQGGEVRLSPKVRYEEMSEPVPVVRMKDIRNFMEDTRIVTREELDSAGYVLEGKDGRIINGVNDIIYAKLPSSFDGSEVGIYRETRVHRDPETGENLGLEALTVATARLVSMDGDVGTFEVVKSNEEIRRGDVLLSPESDGVPDSLTPKAPEVSIDGQMIAVPNGVTQIGKYNVVVINRGSEDGLSNGDILRILKSGNTVRDPRGGDPIKLPDEEAGLMIVFKNYEKLSYGMVLKASEPLSVGDKVSSVH